MNKKTQEVKPVDAPDYSYWQALYMAIYSSRLFIDVAKRWSGVGLLYLFLLALLGAVPLSARLINAGYHYFDDQLIHPIEQMPLLVIQNGKASLDKPMPYFIKNNTGDVVLIIDTTGKITGFTAEYPKLITLVTQDSLSFRMPGVLNFADPELARGKEQILTHVFGKADNEVFSGKEWAAHGEISKVKFYSILFVYPTIVGVLFGLYFIITFIMASVGRIIGIAVIKFSIPYAASLRLGCVVSTFPYMLMIAIQTFNIKVDNSGFWYIVMVACYYSFALLAIRRESKKVVHA